MSLFFKDRKNIELKVGLFSIIIVIILLLSYSWLTDLLTKQKYTEIRIIFPNVNNLEPGNNVSINGLKRGRVKQIAIREKGVLVTVMVDLDFPLREGTMFIIKESDLMGNHQVDIIPGEGRNKLDYKELQTGESRQGLTDLIYRMNSMAVNVERIFNKLENADNLLLNFNNFLTASNYSLKQIDQFFGETQKNDVKSLISHLNITTKELSEIIINNRTEIESAITLSDQTFKKLNETITVVDSATVYLLQAGKKLNDTNNNAGLLLNDKTLYQNLLRTTDKVDSILVDVKKNPRRYFRISIF